jgi:hypothetical protein
MLAELKFVQGAVAKKDLVPSMTHFRIERGTVRSYNGVLALCSPIALDIDCTPSAVDLVRAISQCDETVTLNMETNGKLRIVSGRFSAYIDCIDGETQHVEPSGEIVNFDGEMLLKAIKTLLPFVGDDASRPWTNGILFRDSSAFATNNVCLAEYWLGVHSPVVINIPRAALKEMLRIDEPPTYAQMDQNSLTLHYSDGRWIRTQLLMVNWPDIRKILDQECKPQRLDETLFQALEKIEDFADAAGRVYLQNGHARTHDERDGKVGASYAVENLDIEGLYQVKMLSLLNGVATHGDFSRYPEPALFFGDNLRGAIIGMRL